MADSVYIVLEPVEIIATDLCLCLQDYRPDATILIADTPEVALQSVERHASISFAFVHADPVGFANTPLGCALAGRGAQCIFMGSRAERATSATWVLERPFSAETIQSIIGNMTRRIIA